MPKFVCLGTFRQPSRVDAVPPLSRYSSRNFPISHVDILSQGSYT